MAETKKTAAAEAEAPKKEAKQTGDPMLELVDFYAFKDSDRYKDDIIVAVNGRVWRIQRGEHVKIPRYVYEVLANSQRQDTYTANLIERETAARDAAKNGID